MPSRYTEGRQQGILPCLQRIPLRRISCSSFSFLERLCSKLTFPDQRLGIWIASLNHMTICQQRTQHLNWKASWDGMQSGRVHSPQWGRYCFPKKTKQLLGRPKHQVTYNPKGRSRQAACCDPNILNEIKDREGKLQSKEGADLKKGIFNSCLQYWECCDGGHEQTPAQSSGKQVCKNLKFMTVKNPLCVCEWMSSFLLFSVMQILFLECFLRIYTNPWMNKEKYVKSRACFHWSAIIILVFSIYTPCTWSRKLWMPQQIWTQ